MRYKAGQRPDTVRPSARCDIVEAPAIAARYEVPVSRSLHRRDPRQGMRWGRLVLIGVALAFLAVFVLLPLLVVFAQAFAKGVGVYLAAVSEPTAWSAIKLTLTVAAIAVPLNLLFGVMSAWAIT